MWWTSKRAAEAEQVDTKTLQSKPLSSISLNEGIESHNTCSASKTNQLFKTAPKRNSPEKLKETLDSGPPHRENFVIKVPVGECMTEKERELPILSLADKVKPRARLEADVTIKRPTDNILWTTEWPMTASRRKRLQRKEPVVNRGAPECRSYVSS